LAFTASGETVYDLLVVEGASRIGRRGVWRFGRLTAAMLKCTAPGGQAATSMRIENYLGFPTQ
jgi:thioredoxin reductase